MKDEVKTKEQLIAKLAQMRQRIAELEAAEIERKRAEEALRESEEKYRALMEEAPIGICNVDTKGKFTYVNKTILQGTGYSREELVGKSAFRLSLISHETVKLLRRRMKEKLMGKPPSPLEIQFKRKDGKRMWLQIRGRLLLEHGVPVGVQIIGEDITERQRAEEALRESEERLRGLFNTMAEGMIFAAPDGQIVQANPVAERILGLKRSEIEARNYVAPEWEILRPDRTTMPPEEMAGPRAMKEKRPVKDVVMGAKRPNGSISWINVSAAPLINEAGELEGVVGTFADITERVRAEEALQEAKKFSGDLIASMQDGFSVLDSHGVHIDVNAALSQMTGFSREELIGVGPPYPYWPPDAYGEIERAFQKTLRGEFGDSELTFMRRNGEHFPVIVSPSWIKDKQGSVISYFATVKDITERVRAEEALQRSERQASAAIEAARGFTFSYDIATGKVIWGGAIEEITGYTPEEFAQVDIEGWAERIHPEDRDEVLSILQEEAIETLGRATAEYRFRKKDGSYVTLASISITEKGNGNPVRLVGILQDITERKWAEEALREYSERLEQMVDERTAELQTQYARLDAILRSTTDGIVVTNEQRSIVQANPVAQAWLTQTLSPEEAGRLREAVQSVARQACAEETRFSGKNPVSSLELTGLDLELSAALISPPPSPPRKREGREGREAAAVVDIHDVSHLKALERMKTMFIDNVAHELRTPVTTIKSYAYLMQRTSPEDEGWNKYLDALVQEVNDQARLGEDILLLSRIYTGRLQMERCPTSLNELTGMAVARHQAMAQERGLTLEYRPETGFL